MATSETTATYDLRIPAAAGGDRFEIDDYRHVFNAIEDLLDGTTTGKTFSFGGAITRDDDSTVAIGRVFTGSAGDSLYHLNVGGTITEASSGTHAVIAGVAIDSMTVTDGGSPAVTSLAALYIAAAPTAGTTPTNGPYSIFVDAGTSRFDGDVLLPDAVDLALGSSSDALLRWSTGDSSNHALALGLGDSNQALHITDKAAIATDWNISATTHPNLYIHSNTTPATDYLRLGDHDGALAYIDVVGGTTLHFEIAGNTEVSITASGLTLPANSDLLFTGTTGTNDIVLTNALADALSITDGSADVLVIDTNTSGNVMAFTAALTISGIIAAATASTIGNLTLGDGSIVDSSGAISFGDENLSTTGTLASGLVTESIRFQENTTDTTETAVSTQCGWGQIAGDGSSTRLNESVTFPTAFANECLSVVISFTGLKSDPAATALSQFGSTTDDDVDMRTISVSNTGFTAEAESDAAMASNTNFGYAWIAVGR